VVCRRHRPGLAQPGDGWMLAWSVRGSNIGAASGHDDLLATLRLHKEVPILTTARDRYVAQDACASAIEATYERCSVSLEVPDAHVERERLATPGGVSTAGHLTGERRSLRCRQGRRPRSDRLKDGPYSSRPASCDARAAEGLPRALLHPKRLHGAREAIWVWLRALRSPTTPSLSAAAFAILTRRARSDSYLYERENNNLAVSDGRPPEKAKNKGAFGISMALWCSGRCNPKTR
jgi:hypothetical protein